MGSQYLSSFGDTGCVILYSLDTGKSIAKFRADKESGVEWLGVSASGNHIFTLAGGVIKSWDLQHILKQIER
ncbi:MAG: hypothetical protein K8T89_16955, partial [Planctomycetes bacterium]|nr:hypothetical protein [Planctomycetota bacterium]